MPKFRMRVEWNESTEYHLDVEAGSLEEAEEVFREMWDDGTWGDNAVEDWYYNGDSGYEVEEIGE